MNFFTHLGKFLLMLKGMFSKPENFKMYWKEFMHQCVEIGMGALPIVIIISLFLGAVTTIQTAYQLVSPLVPQSTIAQIVRDSMILELSPTVVSIVLAGVVGSKIASELGNMRVSEQIDALEIMGINTKAYLLFPKILGALVVVPCLIVISAVLGIWGGRTAGELAGILANDTFDIGLRQNLNFFNINFALYKAYTFAFIISSVPAYYGYYVKGGALEIGRASTSAVVVSCILILLADYLLAALLL
ncbi:ABC transporter permease [Sediminibacterium sp.]|jgi:phospholipid/cholesterol/gamma-HCH transport system permease protein|uniref:MlaE family ABC transporter permease n=1 Tax=Sediminibacterium sp. TaxID=1917865 RepID=UPI0008C32011|nr:ABC transporter permease [Sediminibacterium sp.]OHC85816.1 MAG: ABC transporter permease [Sphingobacteriia bacterium RIFOXYC2_FULL_35_18]OHC87351.1 MAG: ABC transporter permease [Sphingobacteriia bacterium RIFOXYD2_FULL_35_12]OYW82249.1 MAG: ABC transporter permease [Sphingobacteriia bacterium 32-37-4]OYY12068.1 MAG: ABC transporter permease [Sphingobacteriia bacterium 35-36-14]OYZ01444.1 MAG: ABC transporter permease [Sphingobacteriia bacterium 28-36-52]OYZ54901.1 MAG: ABC transporter per